MLPSDLETLPIVARSLQPQSNQRITLNPDNTLNIGSQYSSQ